MEDENLLSKNQTATRSRKYPYLVQEIPSFPPFPRFTSLLHKFSMAIGHSALGDRAFSLFLGSVQQGAAGNALIWRFSFVRAATACLHLEKRKNKVPLMNCSPSRCSSLLFRLDQALKHLTSPSLRRGEEVMCVTQVRLRLLCTQLQTHIWVRSAHHTCSSSKRVSFIPS